MKSYWMLVLHSHLPFVKHPEYDYFLEEHWLYEAITECYAPMLLNFEKLKSEGKDFRLTISMTPPLCEMLSDDFLMDRYLKYLDRTLELCKKEMKRTANDFEFNRLAEFYYERIKRIKNYVFEELNGNILHGYRKFLDLGNIEIITCGATHGFLPFISVNDRAVNAQIKVAVESHKKHFGQYPEGIWLPECAYYEGLDKILQKNGIRYFFVDTHGIIFSKPRPVYGVYAPVYTSEGVAAFGRDVASSRQVWSSKEGYPGDYNYRDFYRDVGYDLDFDYIKDYIVPDGTRVFTGLKYYKITGNTEHKLPYNPEAAFNKTIDHARHFLHERIKFAEEVSKYMDRPPLIVSPYDAELFGHWWFEGPDFIYNLFKEMSDSGDIIPVTPMKYLNEYETNQVVRLNPSSWGDKGYFEVWLNGTNDWIYRHIVNIGNFMTDAAEKFKDSNDERVIRCLNQMARELLLAQSSDWAFLMTTGTAIEYATRRTKEHIHNFMRLYNMLAKMDLDYEFLSSLEFKNSIFSDMDLRKFYI
ncbi:MAG: 1,4-alpha-glucan branching enzyme [Deferribacteres bacterium]|nr:1,4-alpha-glucan branching enzyme [Deferribacteres bacterium]